MDIYCKNCRGTVLYCSNPARSLPEYGVLRCTVDGCFHQIAICTFCDKKISVREYDFRTIKKHVTEHHNIMSGVKDHVDHDGSNNNDSDDFEVIDAPPTIGWPRHGFETETAEFLKQQTRHSRTPDQQREDCRGWYGGCGMVLTAMQRRTWPVPKTPNWCLTSPFSCSRSTKSTKHGF